MPDGRVALIAISGTELIVARLSSTLAPLPVGFVPLTPSRLLETRSAEGEIGYSGGKPVAGQTIELSVTPAGVPLDAAAVAINVTGTEAAAAGYVTVWPCGTPRPTASNLNLVPGVTSPNLVITRVGDNGTVCLLPNPVHISSPTSPATSPAGSAFNSLPPSRVLETRSSEGQIGYSGPKPVAGQTIELSVSTGMSAPSAAPAVALNVTATEAAAAGYVTVWPCGTPSTYGVQPQPRSRRDLPNLVITRVGDNGKVCLSPNPAQTSSPTSPATFPWDRHSIHWIPSRGIGNPAIGRSGWATQALGQACCRTDDRTVHHICRGPTRRLRCGAQRHRHRSHFRRLRDGVAMWHTSTYGVQPQPRSRRDLPEPGHHRVGDNGKVCLFTQSGTNLIADLAGYFLTSDG